MDLILLAGIATALLVVLITLLFLNKSKSKSDGSAAAAQAPPAQVDENVPRRAQVVRNQRNRARVAQIAEPVGDSEEEDTIPPAQHDYAGEKMGAKKRAKLEAKAQKKTEREQELRHREEQKKREALLEEERRKQAEKEEQAEKNREEAERLAREEKERKEHEEYLLMKQAFSVEEEGYEEEDADGQENSLQEFIKFIQDNKVVVLEDLAVQFKLKVQAVIDRIGELQKEERITGVIDDRGKFIYVSEEELKSVAKFIKQRGRISITELAENSNQLINLTPVVASESA
ncbi:DDRGK domain-containing protein 1 [Anopheles stephensi]|uniref:DDRGK domain-containing protein 1 n=1 Tax=Anopheles stephensi TaxID=30069 RepID=UPI0007D45BA2|nr:DDRGK domain-containing protein 1 [Anopheles stephensi]